MHECLPVHSLLALDLSHNHPDERPLRLDQSPQSFSTSSSPAVAVRLRFSAVPVLLPRLFLPVSGVPCCSWSSPRNPGPHRDSRITPAGISPPALAPRPDPLPRSTLFPLSLAAPVSGKPSHRTSRNRRPRGAPSSPLLRHRLLHHASGTTSAIHRRLTSRSREIPTPHAAPSRVANGSHARECHRSRCRTP